MTQTDFLSLVPFMIIAIAPVVIMIVISILRNYDVVYGFTVFSLFAAFGSLFLLVPFLPHFIEPLFIIDMYSLFFIGIILLSALLITLFSYDYIKQMQGVKEEYYIILLISTLGASLLAIASHFIIFFLGIEMLSISLYIMIAFRRTRDISVEAGIKYLILASVSSAFLLFGMALIYTTAGSMEFSGIVKAINTTGQWSTLAIAGFGMMLLGIGFKLALVPFHMWAPDVYQGAPAPVSAFIATVSKGAVMAVLIRFFYNFKAFDEKYIFVVIALISMISMFTGNLLALRQKNLKRLLAYSSIANMGYLIVILLIGNESGIQTSLFYLLSYFITTIGAFGVISLLSTEKHEAEKIEDFSGLFWKKPWIAIVFTLSLLSLAGIPITAGFIAKFYLILEGMKAGLLILIFSIIINSVIGLYYYLRVITSLFLQEGNNNFVNISITGNIALAIIASGILLLGIYPGWLIDIIEKFASL
jgi:NADH-quinone oxidoreductase subunit N